MIGLGNVLMGDDAFGPYVIRVLEAACEFPPEVEVADLGTPGLELTPLIAGRDAVIVVDTVTGRDTPGTLRTYTLEAILERAPQTRLSPHEPALKEALLMADFAGAAPSRALLVGVIPERLGTGIGMSLAVHTAVDAAVEQVLDELARLGVPARPRPSPASPDIWWERQPRPIGW